MARRAQHDKSHRTDADSLYAVVHRSVHMNVVEDQDAIAGQLLFRTSKYSLMETLLGEGYSQDSARLEV